MKDFLSQNLPELINKIIFLDNVFPLTQCFYDYYFYYYYFWMNLKCNAHVTICQIPIVLEDSPYL